MERFYVYHAALIVIGATLGLQGLAAEGVTAWSALMAVGGVGLVATAGATLLRREPEDVTIDDVAYWPALLGAALVAAGALLRFLA